MSQIAEVDQASRISDHLDTSPLTNYRSNYRLRTSPLADFDPASITAKLGSGGLCRLGVIGSLCLWFCLCWL
jgi:hypothetical protein